MSETRPHALYRFYGSDGQLLYVGITADPGKRFPDHQKDKPWWTEVRGISVEEYPNRDAVLNAERLAIQVENPKYNKSRPSLPSTKSRPSAQVLLLVWICEECRLPISDKDGYIHVNRAEVYEVEQALRAWRQKYKRDDKTSLMDLSGIMSRPASAHWRVHHSTCDPEPLSDDYTIDVHRARTHAHLLSWTAHLLGKRWIGSTDWIQLIRRMATIDA